jgi:hypothetical protein
LERNKVQIEELIIQFCKDAKLILFASLQYKEVGAG